MSVLDRKRQPADAVPPGVAEAIMSVARAAVGRPCRLAEGPEPVVVGAGPDMYSFRLAVRDPQWAEPLLARLRPPEALRREVGWMRAVSFRGLPVPEVVADYSDVGVVLFRPSPGTNLAGRMATDIMGMPRYLQTLGRFHARLHALPVGEPPPSTRVICHGELYPTNVYLADDDSVVADNWTRSCLADPTYDVASTLVAFWALPLFAENAIQRRMITMARDSLATSYLDAYRGDASWPLHEGALRHWQGFHLQQLAADLSRRRDGEPLGAWNPASTVADPAKALADIRARQTELA